MKIEIVPTPCVVKSAYLMLKYAYDATARMKRVAVPTRTAIAHVRSWLHSMQLVGRSVRTTY